MYKNVLYPIGHAERLNSKKHDINHDRGNTAFYMKEDGIQVGSGKQGSNGFENLNMR